MRPKQPGHSCAIASPIDTLPPAGRHGSLSRLWPILLVLILSAWLRAPAAWRTTPFDVDEALYATYGRQISHENNPALAGLSVDKPPLYFYTLALSFKLFGQPSEWAARLPTVFASLLTLSALWRLSLRLYRSRLIASLAALLFALSPLDISYAGSVFTDPLTSLWITLALLAVVRGRWGVSGLFAALAFSTKQSALASLPLILAVSAVSQRPKASQVMQFIAAAGLVLILPFAWDTARGGEHTSWWVLGAANNAPQRLARSDEIVPRLQIWEGYLSSSAGSPWNLGLVMIGTLMLALQRPRPYLKSHVTDLIWLAYTLGYSLLYCLVAFSLYPRYAHFLTLPLTILGGRITAHLFFASAHTKYARILLAGALLALTTGLPESLAARTAPEWQRPAHERHSGIEAAAAYLNTLPPGTIVYDHWAGWLLGWYTGQDRPPDMWMRTVYYPTPEQLAAGALAQPDPFNRYFVVPDWAPAAPWLAALGDAGFSPQPAITSGRFIIYELSPPQPSRNPQRIPPEAEEHTGGETVTGTARYRVTPAG